MIKVSDIYSKTHDGLDIILDYYPQAEGCVDNKKKFKRRPEEDDASACIKKFKVNNDYEVYKVTDFGDQSTAMSPVDICMYEEGISFSEAIFKLASRYNVTNELNKSVNKPDIRKRPAKADEKEGSRFFELEKTFTADQLKIMGPRVKQEHIDRLNWYVAKSISYVKNREVTTKYTTPTYPIFMRECIVQSSNDPEKVVKFYKIYEPLNPDKQWRFSYTPDGVKPKEFINGLEELKKLYREYNAKEEALFKQDPKNEDKPYKEKKLEEAFICSGERDSLCVASLGYSPLWFNSETYKVSPEEIKEIYKYVEKLYNIPDIDSTGIRKATELALKYMDILTVWLPSWLTTYKDWRGKPRKDFRDFMELRQRNEDFRNLLKMAMPARFWEITQNEKTGKKQYEIDADCLHYFLKLNGFHALRDENSANTQYVRVVGRIVSSIKGKDIRTFLRQFARERYLDRNIRNLILNSPRMSDGALENLDEITLDFTSYTRKSQYFFFPNAVWEVTGGKIETQLANMGITDRYVWEENVIPHNVKVLPDMFTIKRNKLSDGTDAWDIDIHEHASNIFRYLINTSRTHWRKELEYSLDHLDNEEADRYRLEHLFDIAGPNLEPVEIAEQKQNLINKIFAIGYILHRYKSPSRAWSPYAMDNKLGEDGDSNGRSGKSFLFKTFDHFMKTVKLSGRNPKLMDNPHVFDQITQHTDFLLIDDCDRYTSTGLFYDVISSDMTVNPKNNQSFNIPYKDSPKIGFTTNFVPVDFDPSTEGRLLYMVFSDYYHQRTPDNDYLETRSIRDDFGKNLLTDYNEEEWNQDINFMLQCCKFYLSLIDDSVKILPPMDNIMRRKYKADMGAGFEDWAKGYFAEDGDKVNVLVDRQSAFQDFINFSGMRKCTMQRFTKALKGFANLTPYVKCLNPEVMRNSSGRITRKIDGKSCDMIYIQTVSATGINDMEMAESETNQTPAQIVIKGFTDTKTDSGNVSF